MRKLYFLSALALISLSTSAQAFRKHSFIIGVSEGSTWGHYSTCSSEGPIADDHIHGVRDPFTLEFGLTNRWGIGINMGGDIYEVDPLRYYHAEGFAANKSVTSEMTIELNYHLFISDRKDLSLVGSFGSSSVTMKEKVSDKDGLYAVQGSMLRLGLHYKYYFWKHLGAQVMLSTFSAVCGSPVNGSPSTFGKGVTTGINGWALEYGLVYRFGKLHPALSPAL